jgi:3'(2'), 5'-bisphosphate nucleotidase
MIARPDLDREVARFADRLHELTDVVVAAAAAIRGIDPARVPRRRKRDGSLVTAADETAQASLLAGLSRILPALPAVCEEQESRPALRGSCFALIDPLDGTREFLEGREEYTVNLAILVSGVPVVGIVAQPARGELWRGIAGRGAARLRFDPGWTGPAASEEVVHTRAPASGGMRAVVSRSHLDAATAALLSRLPIAQTLTCGSSVKFCRVAEGAADFYPRLAPTFEWDLAAGHAVLAAAGGSVIRPDGKPLLYGGGRGEGAFRVPAFLAFGSPSAGQMLTEALRQAASLSVRAT